MHFFCQLKLMFTSNISSITSYYCSICGCRFNISFKTWYYCTIGGCRFNISFKTWYYCTIGGCRFDVRSITWYYIVLLMFVGLFGWDLHLHVGQKWNSDQRSSYDLHPVSLLLLDGGRWPLPDAGKLCFINKSHRISDTQLTLDWHMLSFMLKFL